MRVLLQRVKRATVSVDGKTVSSVGKGILAFVGFARQDTELYSSRSRLQKVKTRNLQLAGTGERLMISNGYNRHNARSPVPARKNLLFAGDSSKAWDKILQKIVNLRIFPDSEGKLNLSVADINGEILVVSQFTLLADCRKGRRPGFSEAARPEKARELFNRFKEDLQRLWPKVATGVFGAEMDVEFCNWGPVTIWLDSEQF